MGTDVGESWSQDKEGKKKFSEGQWEYWRENGIELTNHRDRTTGNNDRET